MPKIGSLSQNAIIVILALPVLTIVGSLSLTATSRGIAVIGLGLIGLAHISLLNRIKRNLTSFPIAAIVLFLLFLLPMGFSSFWPLVNNTKLSLFGEGAEHLGLLYWASFMIVALYAMQDIHKRLFSRSVLAVTTFVGMFSLIGDQFYITHGLRVAGLLYHPTSMAMYSCIAVVVALHFIKKREVNMWGYLAFLSLALHTAIIVLTQSRIGYLWLLIILLVHALYAGRNQYKVKIITLLVTTVVICLPIVLPGFFSRYHQESVTRGTNYRGDLYITATKDIIRHNVILGNGPSSLPHGLNDKRAVPEDILKTLNVGHTFSSAHNLFLDLAYYFGLVSALGFLGFMIYGLQRFIRKFRFSDYTIGYLLIFGALLLNATFNVPSVELTLLFFVLIFGLYAKKVEDTTTKT